MTSAFKGTSLWTALALVLSVSTSLANVRPTQTTFSIEGTRMAKGTPINPLVAKVCSAHPDAANRTLAKLLLKKYPLQFVNLERARSAIRNYRGNMGKKSLKHATKNGTARPGRKPGEMPQLPESSYQEPVPFELDAGRVLIISDLHCPYQSNVAIEAALKHADDFKPQAIFVNGDLLDFYQLSRFDKDPTMPKVSAELEAGRQFWAHVRARYPRAKLFYKLGNHDIRFATYIFQAAPLLADIPGIRDGWEVPCGIRASKVTVIDDKRPVMLGKLAVFHGHEMGGAYSPVSPSRGAYLKTKHTALVSHHHQTSGHSDPNVWHDETFCWSIACLCGLSPRYMTINRWNWGFATVTVHKGGEFDVHNLRITREGKVRTS